MLISATIQFEHNQSNVLAGANGFPDLRHRFSLVGSVLDVGGSRSLVNDMAQTVTANLRLIEQYVNATQATLLDFQTIYYGLHSIRKELGDMRAMISHLRSVWKNNYRDLLPGGLAIFDVMDQMFVRAEGIISLLCHQFADDDIAPPKNAHVCGAITSVIQEVSEISETVNDLHLATKKRPA